ncbi:hypothetical protein [Serratia quinivorans]|uniref:hypothetical protein n=1 Tax=Serratia quinivorans TaxID=137545 RepID=UPI00217A5997|nr:hypothetical protein [Serratia quinivorans]CAI1026373.1 Uncharacterised protein [Serratia quinivorans]CAI1785791.1 Uncharacterised protein [Serratia quinivorans]
MLSFWKIAFKYGAGLAVISAVVFLCFNKQWVESGLFTSMTTDQTFYAFIISLGIAFVLAISFLICYYKDRKEKQKTNVIINAENNSNAINNSGNGNVTITKGR